VDHRTKWTTHRPRAALQGAHDRWPSEWFFQLPWFVPQVDAFRACKVLKYQNLYWESFQWTLSQIQETHRPRAALVLEGAHDRWPSERNQILSFNGLGLYHKSMHFMLVKLLNTNICTGNPLAGHFPKYKRRTDHAQPWSLRGHTTLALRVGSNALFPLPWFVPHVDAFRACKVLKHQDLYWKPFRRTPENPLDRHNPLDGREIYRPRAALVLEGAHDLHPRQDPPPS